MKKNIILIITLALVIVGIVFVTIQSRRGNQITILCWSGYDEKEIREYIEEKVPNTSLRFVTYTGGEEMLRKFLSSGEKFDLLLVDAEYGKILHDQNKLQLLDFNKMTDAKKNISTEYLPVFRPENYPPGSTKTGALYGIVVRWGAVGLAGRSDLDATDDYKKFGYGVLSLAKNKNRISIYDWYLPNMGVFSLMYMEYLEKNGVSVKNRNPYDLNDEELDEMYSNIMIPIRENISNFYADLGFVIQSAYDERTYAIPGIGEWAIGNQMLEEKSKFTHNWFIPKQGGIMWTVSLAIPSHVKNQEKLDVIYKVIDVFTTAEFQSKLAWTQAYASHVPNKLAYEKMDLKKQDILRYREIEDISKQLHFRKVPENNVNKWIEIWAKFKNAKNSK